jgi:MFS-type transporter involved in bile tolerance (Atg22 family)
MFNLANGGSADYAGMTFTGDSFYAVVLGISSIFVAIVSPVLGAIADRMPIKKKILRVYTVVGILFTGLMGLAPYMDDSSSYKFLAICLIMGNIGFAGGHAIYSAFLPYLGDKRLMDHISSWGYAYGFLGGCILLTVHLAIGLRYGFEDPDVQCFVFVTSALWWLGFSVPMFRNTPEPEIPNPTDYSSLFEAVKDGVREIRNTFSEIRRYKVLTLFMCGYLLFYDGVNAIGGLAAAYADSVLRIDFTMNFVLLLSANIVAIPMTIIGGSLASKYGNKNILGGALTIFCVVSVLGVGFAPLELGDDHERYDFQYDWNEEEGAYKLSTLYDRGVDGWVSESGEGDEDFRVAFLSFLKNGGSEISLLSLDDASLLSSNMVNETNHRFSFSFRGGDLDGDASVGKEHPTIIEGGPIDWWPNLLRDNIWEPAGLGINLQWIILGMSFGMVMGVAGALSRSLFSVLIPTTKTTEFFGFFAFIGKAVSVLGPIVYAIVAASMDSRMGLLSVVVPILMGMCFFFVVDVEEGIRVANKVDEEARGGEIE